MAPPSTRPQARPRVRTAPALLALSLAVVPALALGALVAGPAGAVDTSTCHGKATTMVVESAMGDVNGTAGDDVVVVVGTSYVYGSFVHTLGGNDSICFVGTENGVTIDAGAGDDYVSTVDGTSSGPDATYVDVNVELGPGIDTFVGGPSKDVVSTGDAVDSMFDVIDLGPGDDTMVDGASLPATAVVGGPGVDRLAIDRAGVPPWSVPWVSDVDHTVNVGGGVRSFAPDFEVFAFNGRVSFRGGEVAEQVVVGNVPPGESPYLDMGAGDDTIVVDQTVGGSFMGGPGTDQLVTTQDGRIHRRQGKPDLSIDLGKGKIEIAGRSVAGVHDIESVDTEYYDSVRVTGSDRRDDIHIGGCRAEVDARGGADRVDFDTVSCSAKAGVQLLAFGGPGNDLLKGGRGHDVLHGGPGDDVIKGRGGRDTAYGDAGRDHCSAERRISC